MQRSFSKMLKSWEVAARNSFGSDISSPWGRFLSRIHFQLFDHGFLRTFWTNFDEVSPGVYRSNHPSKRRLAQMKAMGVKTILNLRGESHHAHYLFEKEATEDLGLTLVNIPLKARSAVSRERLLELIEAMRTVERPFLMHCKSGADRAGMASAIYRIVFDGASVEEARAHLSLRYIHLKNTKTGICDYLLDVYDARNQQSPIGFEEWVKTEYDPKDLKASFKAKRRGQAK